MWPPGTEPDISLSLSISLSLLLLSFNMNTGIKQADYVGLHETLQSSAWPLFKFRELYNWTELIEKPPQNDAETTSITYK